MDMTAQQKIYEGICFRCVQVLRQIAEKFSPKEFESLRAAVLSGDLEHAEYLNIMETEIAAPN